MSAFTPAKNDGTTVYKLNVKECRLTASGRSASTTRRLLPEEPIQRLFAQQHHREENPDGSVDIQFGGCDGKIPNCLPIMAGWNYTVRLYRPRKEILNGRWKFPEAQPVK